MGFDDTCNTGLGLGLGLGLGYLVKQESFSQSDHQQKKKNLFLRRDHFFLSLTLGPSDGIFQSATKIGASKVHGESIDLQQQQASSLSAVSSFSNSNVKMERDFGGGEVKVQRVSSRFSDEDDEGSPRKKLRLSKEQSAILEDNFKEQSTLNPKQKQALAEQLNLRPRQVEVWFQNRRARTKLKQTGVECELLKKCCETLTEENKRLQKELQELKSLKLTPSSYCKQLPAAAAAAAAAATLKMCPSCCERVANGGGGENPSTSTSIPFTIGQKSHFCNPLSRPSAAC